MSSAVGLVITSAEDVDIRAVENGEIRFRHGSNTMAKFNAAGGVITNTLYGTTILSIAGGAIESGTYTPTLTAVANITSGTTTVAQYMRVGNVVTVSGKADNIAETTVGLETRLGISLPIASNIGATNNCCGVGALRAINDQSSVIVGDSTNDRALMIWGAKDTAAKDWYYTFTYLVA
jgi:hypothetical protein